MKIFFGAILALALIVMGYFIFKTSVEEHRLARTVKRILGIGFLIVFINEISLFVESKQINLLTYSIYFAASDWLLYYMLKFSMEYVGSEFNEFVNRKLMLFVLTVDTISLALNNVFGHLFHLNGIRMSDNEIYYELAVTHFFYIHYFIIMMLVAFCLASLLYRAFHAPLFYRSKYLLIAVIMVVIVVMNVLTFKSAIDISIMGYAVEAICIYYCVFIFTPQRLLQKTLLLVAQDMSVALFVLDIEGKRLYNNKCAEQLLSRDHALADREGTTLEEWCRHQYLYGAGEFNGEQTFYRGIEEVILKIQLQRMVDGNKQLQGGYFVIQDRTEEINKLKEERYQATHDSLTGLYNKEYFCEEAEKYINGHAQEELLILCTDIREFKMINDLFGAKVGDSVLVNCARMLEDQVNGALIYGRIGNDIFGVLMPKAIYDEEHFANEAQKAFASCMDKNAFFPLINNIGVYEITDRTIPVSVMCDRARMAIATIKGDYHKRVAYYDDVLRENIRYEQELISELDDAIREGQLKMYLQPQVSTEGKILGGEALVRWQHPVKGMIAPIAFIPVFEKNGLISDVDKYMWESACKQLRKWKDEGKEDLYISVNISPRDFYLLNIYQVFTELVNKYDIAPQNLKLEITETAVVIDLQRQMELIERLRRIGFVVEMDDFGSGYSSLNMLKDIHVDVLKIDMAFLRKAEDEERSKKILQMIISLSGQLGMPVITEGVETAEQVEILTEMGCDMFQGYYFAKPMEVEKFEELYLEGGKHV